MNTNATVAGSDEAVEQQIQAIETPAQPETVMVKDLHQFTHHLAYWHNHKVAELRHMCSVPEGTLMESNGVQVILEGDMRSGFIAGVELALMNLGTLPFTVETEDGPVN